MNFIEAIELLKLSKLDGDITIKRRTKDYEITLTIWGVSQTNKHFEDWLNYKPSMADSLAEDWYVVKDEKLHTFEEAVKAFKEGKTIHRNAKNAVYYNTKHDSPDTFNYETDDIIINDDWIIEEN